MHRSYTRRFAGTGVAICLLVALAPSLHAGISIQANYLDAAGEGFNDATLGAQRQNAFEYALNIWGNALGESYSGETIVIDAEFNDLGGDASSATLGQAGTTGHYNLNTSNPLVYASALANHIVGYDLSAGSSEGAAQFNSAVDGTSVLSGYTWYYGTDNNAGANEIDFVSTALHEIGHALGFAGSLYYTYDTESPYYSINGHYTAGFTSSLTNGNADTGGERFNAFDFFVGRLNGDGSYTQLVDLTATERMIAATSGNLYWGGADAFAANGGAYPKLYAPSTWQQGSSYSHLDETTFALELMSPTYTTGTPHALSDLTIAMMVDMGWDSNVPEPGTLAVWSVLAVGVSLSRRRRRSSVRSLGEAA